jgi:hypothetical protein
MQTSTVTINVPYGDALGSGVLAGLEEPVFARLGRGWLLVFVFFVVIPEGNLLFAFLVVIPSAASEPAVSRSSFGLLA